MKWLWSRQLLQKLEPGFEPSHENTVMTLRFQTNSSGQTVQTQIRLLLEEQSDQGLHWLLFNLHHFDKIHFRFGLFVSILGRLQQRFLASQTLGTLRYLLLVCAHIIGTDQPAWILSLISALVVHSSNSEMSRIMRKPTFWFPTWSDTNQAVQLQRMAKGLKFRI